MLQQMCLNELLLSNQNDDTKMLFIQNAFTTFPYEDC